MDLYLIVIFCDFFLLKLGKVAAVNLALRKPTIQGTMFNGLSSDLAVDGDHNPVLSGGSCAHTSTGGNNWWIVDLQSIYDIDKVEVTNRNEQKDRLNNLHVEGFPDGDPYLCPTPMNKCGFNANAGAMVILDCPNSTIARYIKLRGVLSMTVCEVDVFGQAVSGCKKWNMKKHEGEKLQSSFLDLGTSGSPINCFTLCQLQFPLCNIFNYNSVTGSCLAPSKPLKDGDIVNDAEWNLYYTC